MLYRMIKTAIIDNLMRAEDIIDKLNVFYFYNQISKEQYTELMNMVTPTTPINTSSGTSPLDSTATN